MTQETLQPVYSPRDYLSVTTLMDFVRCPRRYFYRKCGLTTRDQGNALQYGTAMHKAVPIAMTEGIIPAMAAFNSEWDDSLADLKRSVPRAYAQLSHYIHTHSAGKSIYSFETPPANPGIELDKSTSPFEVPGVLDVGLDVPIVVRIDGLVRHRDTQELWGYEFKTASKLYGLFDALEMHPQVLIYATVLRTLTGQDIKGIMCEGMLIDAKKVENMTHPIPVQEHLMDGALAWLKYYGANLLAAEKKFKEIGAEAFIKNFCGCTPYPLHYMTGFPCEYQNLCHAPDWEMMTSLYDVKPDHKFIKVTKGET